MISLDEFFSAFFPAPTETIHLRFFSAKGDTPSAIKIATTRDELKSSAELQAQVRKLNNTKGAYFVVNSGGDEDKDITRFNAWFAESDDKTIEEQNRMLDAGPLQPSVRVQTKKSIHAYWLAQTNTSTGLWREMQARLIANYGGDNKIKNPSRVMRIPYFQHISLDDEGLYIRQQIKLEYFNPDLRYTPAQMSLAYPPAHEDLPTNNFACGDFSTWPLLANEAKRRILTLPSCKVHREWAHARGICHDGKGETGLAVNLATGAYFCQAGCDTGSILRALGLPEVPSTARRVERFDKISINIADPVPDLPSVDVQIVGDVEEKPKGIFTVAELSDEIDALYEKGLQPGEDPGFESLGKLYSIKRGQWTVLTGTPGSGKSQLLDNIMLNLACEKGWKFAICSLENQPLAQHCATLIEIHTGAPFNEGLHRRVTKSQLNEGKAFLNEHFTFLLPSEDSCTILGLLNMADYVRRHTGIDGLVIDPWNEFEHRRPANKSETEYIAEILTRIRRFARAYDLHAWLVAHPTKLQRDKDGKYPVPKLYDISGCYAQDTEVLTSSGWKLHEEVTNQDKIACFDLQTGAVCWEYPQYLTAADYEGQMIHFSGRSMDCLVTPNHRMVLQPGWSHEPTNKTDPRIIKRDWQFIAADQVNSNTWLMPYSAVFFDSPDQDSICGVPEAHSRETVDDFLRYLGWWISEGCVQMKGLSICQAEGVLADQMEACQQRLGLNRNSKRESRSSRPNELPMYKSRIYKRLHPLFCNWIIAECGEGAPNKKLPAMTWNLSNRQKLILLNALIDGDGSRYESGNVKYCTTSKQLADDVQRLALHIGLPAAIGVAEGGKINHLRRYTVYIGKPSRKTITLSRWQIKEVLYRGPVYCFTVSTGAYITRRNGKVAFQGNSAHFRNKCDMGLVVTRDPEDPKGPTTVHVQKVRFRWCGSIGSSDLWFDSVTGRYSEHENVFAGTQAPKLNGKIRNIYDHEEMY